MQKPKEKANFGSEVDVYVKYFTGEYWNRLHELPSVPLNVCGRIAKGRGGVQEEFISLTNNITDKTCFLMGPDGMHRFLLHKHNTLASHNNQMNRDDLLVELLHLIGFETEYIIEKLQNGFKFQLLIFPLKDNESIMKLATWDGIAELVDFSFPDIAHHVRKWLPLLKSHSYHDIQNQSSFTFFEVRKNTNDHRYFNRHAFFKCSQKHEIDLVNIRSFLYFEMGVRELFSGDGYTYTPDGKKGVSEYVMPNMTRDNVKGLYVLNFDLSTSQSPEKLNDFGTKQLKEYVQDTNNLTEKHCYFLDCLIKFPKSNIYHQHQSLQNTFIWIESKLRKGSKRNVELKGKLSKITGKDDQIFVKSTESVTFDCPWFLNYKEGSNKLYISDAGNHIIRSMRNISMNNNNDEWNGRLKIEVGQPEQEGYCNGDRDTCKLRCPCGFNWDMNGNMYICNEACVCKVDNKSNQVSLVAGSTIYRGYKDGKNDKARFDGPSGILCYQQNHDRLSSPVMYVCDWGNHCIRMIDITNGETTTFAGKGKVKGDVDGTLESARFYWPWDIVKDDENDHVLYVSNSYKHKIKMIDMKKGMVTTFVGGNNDTSILNCPKQMQIIDSFIYVGCEGYKDCIVKIDKHSKQVTKIKFNDGKQVASDMCGITYHELDRCFYISDTHNIYKFE